MILTLNIIVSLLLFCVPFLVRFFNIDRVTVSQTYHTNGFSGVFRTYFGGKVIDGKALTINFLIGVFFAIVYMSFIYLADDWYTFSPLHIIGFVSTFIMPFALAYLCKNNPKGARIVAIVLSCILLLSPITRAIYMPIHWDKPLTMQKMEMAVPFNLSNICALLFIIGILSKNKTIAGFMISVGLSGGILNNIQTHNPDWPWFWNYLNWESYMVHALMIIIPMFAVLTGQIKLDYKAALKNLYWFIPWFFITGFVFNPMWGTNYNFTAPIDILNFLPKFLEITVFSAHVYPIYMFFVLILLIILCAIFYLFGVFLEKKVSKYFMNINNHDFPDSNLQYAFEPK